MCGERCIDWVYQFSELVLEYSANVIGVVAWPTTVLIVCSIFQDEIRKLAQRLQSLEFSAGNTKAAVTFPKDDVDFRQQPDQEIKQIDL